MDHSHFICITNRVLCREPFLQRLEAVAACQPKLVILREKDLPEAAYIRLAKQCKEICGRYGVPLAVNARPDTARSAGINRLHLPMRLLEEYSGGLDGFSQVGVSVHSREEAARAEALGADYLIAGHIFATDCKKGVPPRGLDFLRQVCQATPLPVYAIGGMSGGRLPEVTGAGAEGICLMSGYMTGQLEP